MLDRVVAEGGCVVLSGPPGIGKTRLLEDLQRQRAAALGAGARPSDRSEPYATATRMLRAGAQRWGSSALSDELRSELARLVPEWGTPPATVVHTARLQWALDHAVQAWGAAGLQALLMDDLHYADDSSLQWLLRWADSASRQAVACVLSCRDQEMPELMRAWWERWSSAGDLIASPDSPRGVRASRPLGLALAPLTPQAIAELLQSLPAETPGIRGEPAMSEAEALHRQAGGTPLYLLHAIGRRGLADHALAQRPDPVRGFVQAQWRSLDATCARLLQVAALVDDRLDAGVAAAVLQVGVLDLDRPWRELESRGLLIDGAVSHDMLSQAVRETMPEAILIALHRMLAQARESRDDAPASVARHWHAAGDWARAARAYEAAARVAGIGMPSGSNWARPNQHWHVGSGQAHAMSTHGSTRAANSWRCGWRVPSPPRRLNSASDCCRSPMVISPRPGRAGCLRMRWWIKTNMNVRLPWRRQRCRLPFAQVTSGFACGWRCIRPERWSVSTETPKARPCSMPTAETLRSFRLTSADCGGRSVPRC